MGLLAKQHIAKLGHGTWECERVSNNKIFTVKSLFLFLEKDNWKDTFDSFLVNWR